MLRFAAALSPLELLMVATAPRQEYFANGKKGCLVRSGCEKSSAEVGDLKLGTRLVVEEEGASSDGTARLRLSSPVAGWVSKKLTVCRTVSDAPDPLTFGLRSARLIILTCTAASTVLELLRGALSISYFLYLIGMGIV